MLVPEAEVTEADDGERFLAVLDQALAALGRSHVPFLLIGGIGSAVFGRDRGTRDIDVLVRPEAARHAARARCARRGGVRDPDRERALVVQGLQGRGAGRRDLPVGP